MKLGKLLAPVWAIVLVILVVVLALASCGPVREAVMSVAPGVPARGDCVEGASVCTDGAPYACSSTHRLWPVLPPRPDGTPRRCPGACVGGGDAGVAHCAGADGGAL